MTDVIYPNPEEAIRGMEDKAVNALLESVRLTHSTGNYPHPVEFLEDRVVFRAYFGAKVGKRSRVFEEVSEALKSQGFTQISLTDMGDGVFYSLEIPE